MVFKIRSGWAAQAGRAAMFAFLVLSVAGCDKCGNRVKFNAPSLPKACGDNADPSG